MKHNQRMTVVCWKSESVYVRCVSENREIELDPLKRTTQTTQSPGPHQSASGPGDPQGSLALHGGPGERRWTNKNT